MLRLQIVFWILAAATVLQRDSYAEDTETTDKTEWAELRVELKDDEGKPVVKAAVMPYAMRVVEQDGHGYWNREKNGNPLNYFSDESGTAVIRYPSKVDYGPKAWTTKLVTFQIRHSDFVQHVEHFEFDPENPPASTEITLQRGCELQLAAVDDNGTPIRDFGVMMAGPYAPDFWADDGNGGRRTSSLKDGTWQTILVKPQTDGPTLFSGLLPLRVRPNQAVKMRGVKLSPGSRVVGKLSDNVPRPVENGYVITTSVPKPAGESWDNESPSLSWHETEPIAEDGTFELASIPRSGELQIIAICDGWVSTTTIPESHSFVKGQLFEVDGETIEPTVLMEKTGSIELTVLKPDGTPLESGSVSAWPNQQYHKGGSTVLGQKYDSIGFVENQLRAPDDQKTPFREDTEFPFMQKIENGFVVLRGLPISRNERIILGHKEYRFPNEAEEREGEHRVKIDTAEPVMISITVVPHEKP